MFLILASTHLYERGVRPRIRGGDNMHRKEGGDTYTGVISGAGVPFR